MSAGEKKATKILAFPALKRIPEPEMPLVGPARDKYMELAGALLVSSKLNVFTRAKCEQVAILHGQMRKRITQNQVVSASSIDAIGKLMKELQLVDESEAIAPVASGAENRFSRIGVIIRPGTQKAELRSS